MAAWGFGSSLELNRRQTAAQSSFSPQMPFVPGKFWVNKINIPSIGEQQSLSFQNQDFGPWDIHSSLSALGYQYGKSEHPDEDFTRRSDSFHDMRVTNRMKKVLWLCRASSDLEAA